MLTALEARAITETHKEKPNENELRTLRVIEKNIANAASEGRNQYSYIYARDDGRLNIILNELKSNGFLTKTKRYMFAVEITISW